MSELELPPDPVTGPREYPCGNNHPPELSSRRWHSHGNRWRWVCQECDRSRMRRLSSEALQRRLTSSTEAKRKGRQLSKLSGSAPSWRPGLAHCETDSTNPDWTRRPTPATAYLLATCNGRKGLPACPVRAQCLKWAQKEPMFVGIAGGQMFGKTDKEEESAA